MSQEDISYLSYITFGVGRPPLAQSTPCGPRYAPQSLSPSSTSNCAYSPSLPGPSMSGRQYDLATWLVAELGYRNVPRPPLRLLQILRNAHYNGQEGWPSPDLAGRLREQHLRGRIEAFLDDCHASGLPAYENPYNHRCSTTMESSLTSRTNGSGSA